MDLEKLEKMANLVLTDLRHHPQAKYLFRFDTSRAKVQNLLAVSIKVLPEHEDFFRRMYNMIKPPSTVTVDVAISAIMHILEIIELEKAGETKIKRMKIFESAEDKMKQANISFRKDDYASVVHNLNTTLELVLKDKVGIPTTITKINTSTIIDILVKDKVEAHLYLAEAKKHILKIDNKIKHQSYSPSKIDCINAIKVMEELLSRLRGKELKLTEETRNKIYKAL